MGTWLEQVVRQFQLVVEVRPTNCSDLYDVLAEVADKVPPPHNQLDTICARYLMQSACMGMAAPLLGAFFSGVDASLGWASVWAALKLIGNEEWPLLPGELRALAARTRKVQSLPRRVETHLRAHFTQTCRLTDVARRPG